MFSLSPITRNEHGEYTFTVTEDWEYMSLDPAGKTITDTWVEERQSTYRTNGNGLGLWRDADSEWAHLPELPHKDGISGPRQVYDTNQFNLNRHDRRGYVLIHFLHANAHDGFSYEDFLDVTHPDISPRPGARLASVQGARSYYAWLKDHDLAA